MLAWALGYRRLCPGGEKVCMVQKIPSELLSSTTILRLVTQRPCSVLDRQLPNLSRQKEKCHRSISMAPWEAGGTQLHGRPVSKSGEAGVLPVPPALCLPERGPGFRLRLRSLECLSGMHGVARDGFSQSHRHSCDSCLK